MPKITINKELSFNLPNGWNDVSFDLGLLIVEKSPLSLSDVISILADLDKEKVRQIESKRVLDTIAEVFPFLQGLPDIQQPITLPRFVYLSGEKLPVADNQKQRFDLGKLRVGQIEDMLHHINQVMQGEGEPSNVDILKLYAHLVAIYAQPVQNGNDYDYEEAMELRASIEAQLSIIEVMTIGAFFLRILLDFKSGNLTEWQPASLPLRKLRLALKGLVSRSGLWGRSIWWRVTAA